jgi:heavy metal sensor kinase
VLTIKGKIVLASTLVFGATLLVFAFLIYESTKQAELAKLDARLESQAEKLESEIEEQLDEHRFPDLDDIHNIHTEGLPKVLLQVWDSTGHALIGDSTLSSLTTTEQQPSRLKQNALESLRGHHKAYRCLWYPADADERVPMVLQVAAPLDPVHESLEHLRILFVVTIPAALLLIALAAHFITRTAFRPLTGMATVAQGISGSNLGERLVVPEASDEVRSLAETLNRMIERIELAFRSQRQFVADASHEIRTPLTIINSELEFAQKSATEAAVQESIRISLSEIDRLSHMVDGLMLLARLDAEQTSPQPQPFRLDEVVVETVQFVRRLAQAKSITLDLYVQEAFECSGDPEMLRRAILNVLDNAIKYSLTGGTVSVRLHESDLDRGFLVLDIEDHGPGIPDADQARLFERFFRSAEARAETDGSGLGLAISRILVALNGGRILVQSATGKGTLVTIELPRKIGA